LDENILCDEANQIYLIWEVTDMVLLTSDEKKNIFNPPSSLLTNERMHPNLSNLRLISTAMGSSIEIRSYEDTGTTISLTVPV
jgi:hypothetical protein